MERNISSIQIKMFDYFTDFISTHPFSEFRVGTMCSSLFISRSSFYSYFENSDDFKNKYLEWFKDLIKEYYGDQLKILNGKGGKSSSEEHNQLIAYLNTIRDNIRIYSVAFKLDMTGVSKAIEEKINERLIKSLPEMNETKWKVTKDFLYGGMTIAIVKWVENGFAMDSKAIAEQLLKIYQTMMKITKNLT